MLYNLLLHIIPDACFRPLCGRPWEAALRVEHRPSVDPSVRLSRAKLSTVNTKRNTI